MDRFDLANPLTHPAWFWEDVCLLWEWFAEDNPYPAQLIRSVWDGLISLLSAHLRFTLHCLIALISVYTIFYGTLLFLKVRRNYLGYLALGPGARPSNIGGWLRHECLKFLVVDFFRVDAVSMPYLDPSEDPYNGHLLDLAQREEPRPQFLGIGPIKQVTAINRVMAEHYQRGFDDLARTHRNTLQSVRGARTGLPTLQLDLEAVPAARRDAVKLRLGWEGEIAHVRPDGGLQISALHPGDAGEVVQRGWAQRDRLAVLNEFWLWRFLYNQVLRRSTPVPSTSVIVYAPLNEAERDVVVTFVEAAVWWAEHVAGHGN